MLPFFLWSLLIWFVFAYVTQNFERGFWAWLFSFSFTIAARSSWAQRGQAWFWTTLVGLALAHVYLLLALDWPSPPRGYKARLPIAVVHYGLMRGVFWCGERLFKRRADV